MSTSSPGIQHRSLDTLRRVGFLLIDNFTMISLTSAIEPLRMANQLSSKELFRWFTISERGEPVAASDGLILKPDFSFADAEPLDAIIVVGGVDIGRSYTQQQLRWLQGKDRQGVALGAICTGTYVLAASGLLDGHECSAHWECQAAIRESFPKVITTNRLFCITPKRLTCSGGIVPLDMMLNLVHRQHGAELAAAISDMFICDRVRTEQDNQRVPLRQSLGTAQPKLVELVTLMENNLEEPLTLDDLASYVNISRRQLERLFQKHLGCSPSRYYLKLRLLRARQLLRQTSMSIIDVASACGFISTPHFSRCYRAFIGTTPRSERREIFATPSAKEPRSSLVDLEVAALSAAASEARASECSEASYSVC